MELKFLIIDLQDDKLYDSGKGCSEVGTCFLFPLVLVGAIHLDPLLVHQHENRHVSLLLWG